MTHHRLPLPVSYTRSPITLSRTTAFLAAAVCFAAGACFAILLCNLILRIQS